MNVEYTLGGVIIFLTVAIIGLLREMIRLRKIIKEQYNTIVKMMHEER